MWKSLDVIIYYLSMGYDMTRGRFINFFMSNSRYLIFFNLPRTFGINAAMFQYYLYKLGQFIVNRLSLSMSYKFAIFISDLHYFFSFKDRRAVQSNLKCILKSEDNIPSLSREVFRNFGRYLVEFFRMAKDLNEEYIHKKIDIKNREYIDRILKQGKGGIILTAHIGNWELGGVLISKLGYPVVAVALPHKEKIVNDLFNQQRENHGVRVVPTSIAMRKSLEALRKNELVALVADRDFSLKGEALDFLNKKALIPKGAAALSIKTGAPFIPTFLIRQQDGRFALTIEEPIFPFKQSDSENVGEDVMRDFMKRYVSIIEQKIYQYPTQWLMFQEFWIK